MNTQVVTAELRQWIIEQTQTGCRPEDVLAAMHSSGWAEAVALAALESTLQQFLDAQGQPSLLHLPPTPPAQPGRPSTVTSAQQGSNRGPVALPEPALAGSPSQLWAGDHRVTVLLTMQQPRIVVLGGLLTDDECDAMVAAAAPRLARSETVVIDTGGNEINPSRTSEGMFFGRGETPLCARIESRIAALLNWPVVNGEGLQILHYQPGAEYKPHHDYFDPAQPGMAAVLARGGQRVGTLVIYLNTPLQGGGTTFPDVALEVAPIKGNAVFFSYDRPHASTRTLHGGAPVLAGDKWVATKWLRQGEFI
jgi:prolyl 4-hydroxylase